MERVHEDDDLVREGGVVAPAERPGHLAGPGVVAGDAHVEGLVVVEDLHLGPLAGRAPLVGEELDEAVEGDGGVPGRLLQPPVELDWPLPARRLDRLAGLGRGARRAAGGGGGGPRAAGARRAARRKGAIIGDAGSYGRGGGAISRPPPIAREAEEGRRGVRRPGLHSPTERPTHGRASERVQLVQVAPREVRGVPPRLLLHLLRELGRVVGAGRVGGPRALRPEEALQPLAVGRLGGPRRPEAGPDPGPGHRGPQAARGGARVDPAEGARPVRRVAREELLARGLPHRRAHRARVRRAGEGRGLEAALRGGHRGLAPGLLRLRDPGGDPPHPARPLAHGGRARQLVLRGDQDLGGGGLRLPGRATGGSTCSTGRPGRSAASTTSRSAPTPSTPGRSGTPRPTAWWAAWSTWSRRAAPRPSGWTWWPTRRRWRPAARRCAAPSPP